MKRQLRGLTRPPFQLDFNLYRREVPILGLSDTMLSVIDIHPEGIEQTIVFIHGYAGCADRQRSDDRQSVMSGPGPPARAEQVGGKLQQHQRDDREDRHADR